MSETWDSAIIGAELLSTITQMAAIADLLEDANRLLAAAWLIKTAAKREGLAMTLDEARGLLMAAREGVAA